MKHIFLSYSRTDLTMMARIREVFQAAGLPVWTDEQLEPGTPSWKDSIQKAIEGAGCIVVVLSPDAKQSPWVERELGYAASRGIKIFPVLARGTERDAVPFELINAQWVDIRANDAALKEKLIPSVGACLGIKIAPPPVVSALPTPKKESAYPPQEVADPSRLTTQDFMKVLKFTDKDLLLNRQHKMSLRQRLWTPYFVIDWIVLGPLWLVFLYVFTGIFFSFIPDDLCLSAALACIPAAAALIPLFIRLQRARDVLEVVGEMKRSKLGNRCYLHVGKIKLGVDLLQWKRLAGPYSGEYRAYYAIHGKFMKQLLSLESEPE